MRHGMWEQMHPQVLFLALHSCHPSTQRWCCRLLWSCQAAHTIEIGAFWVSSVMDNSLGVTSDIKFFAASCLGCCSAMLYPANHS